MGCHNDIIDDWKDNLNACLKWYPIQSNSLFFVRYDFKRFMREPLQLLQEFLLFILMNQVIVYSVQNVPFIRNRQTFTGVLKLLSPRLNILAVLSIDTLVEIVLNVQIWHDPVFLQILMFFLALNLGHYLLLIYNMERRRVNLLRTQFGSSING